MAAVGGWAWSGSGCVLKAELTRFPDVLREGGGGSEERATWGLGRSSETGVAVGRGREARGEQTRPLETGGNEGRRGAEGEPGREGPAGRTRAVPRFAALLPTLSPCGTPSEPHSACGGGLHGPAGGWVAARAPAAVVGLHGRLRRGDPASGGLSLSETGLPVNKVSASRSVRSCRVSSAYAPFTWLKKTVIP